MDFCCCYLDSFVFGILSFDWIVTWDGWTATSSARRRR